MPKHVTIAGLEERRAKRLQDCVKERAANMKLRIIPRGERYELRNARAWIAGLTGKQVIALYRAGKEGFKTKHRETH